MTGGDRGTGGAGTGTGNGIGEGAGEGIQAVAVTTTPPEYPDAARRSNQEGTVVLKIQIDKEGRVTAVQVDSTSGHAILDDAAKAAVLTWRYRPATLKGRAMASERHVRLVFRLE